MRPLVTVAVVLSVAAALVPASAGSEARLVLHGPYLGQKPVGSLPEIFAAGIVSTGLYTRDIAITLEGKEIAPGETLTWEKLRRLHDLPGHGNPVIWWVEAGFLQALRPKTAQ